MGRKCGRRKLCIIGSGKNMHLCKTKGILRIKYCEKLLMNLHWLLEDLDGAYSRNTGSVCNSGDILGGLVGS